MRLELETPAPPWLDGLIKITAPGGPFPSAWRRLLAAACSSPAALRAALATYAILLGEEGLPQAQSRALEIRRSIDLQAPDRKSEEVALTLTEGESTLILTGYAATVLYLRDRLAGSSPAWCTRCLAGWRHTLLPREEVLGWFKAGAPDVAPCVLIARAEAHEVAELGRLGRVIEYDALVTTVLREPAAPRPLA